MRLWVRLWARALAWWMARSARAEGPVDLRERFVVNVLYSKDDDESRSLSLTSRIVLAMDEEAATAHILGATLGKDHTIVFAQAYRADQYQPGQGRTP